MTAATTMNARLWREKGLDASAAAVAVLVVVLEAPTAADVTIAAAFSGTSLHMMELLMDEERHKVLEWYIQKGSSSKGNKRKHNGQHHMLPITIVVSSS
jgi:hypothetical protein